jgi:hypothetical protein
MKGSRRRGWPVPAVLLNIVIGLVTTVLSGGSVLAWRHMKDARMLRGKAAFFGFRAGGTCLIIMNNHWQKPGSTSHNDVHTMIEVAGLAHEAGCPISVLPADDLHENNGDRIEFCIGGPTSNPRTAGHMAAHLPGVRYRAYSSRRDSGAIVVSGKQFLLDHGQQEHALVAKFIPAHSSSPVIVIYGQRAIDNRAAIHFLKREYRKLAKAVDSVDRFCLIIRVISADTYGYQAAELAADVTDAAFTVPRRTSVTTKASSQG